MTFLDGMNDLEYYLKEAEQEAQSISKVMEIDGKLSGFPGVSLFFPLYVPLILIEFDGSWKKFYKGRIINSMGQKWWISSCPTLSLLRYFSCV